MKPAILAVVVLLLICAQSRAGIMAAPSVEWLTCSSDAVVVGKITRVNPPVPAQSIAYEGLTVEIGEVIKGDVKDKELIVSARSVGPAPTVKDFMNSKDGLLLFLSRPKDVRGGRMPDGWYVPTSTHPPLSIFDLSNLPSDVYSKDMKILTDPKAVLEIVRQWADSKISHSLRSEVDFGSPIHRRLYGGSACFLIVPAEEKYRAVFLAMARSAKPHERRQAALELYKFPGEETEQVLRELLKDETEVQGHFSADTISQVIFTVREAAWQSLKAMGKPVPDMPLEREPTEAEQRSLRQSYWQKSFKNALSGGWEVISVEDGDSRLADGRRTIAVIVTCGQGDSRCRFTLIPKEWGTMALPAGERLGSQGGRHFLLDGALPENVKEKLIRYFGLQKP